MAQLIILFILFYYVAAQNSTSLRLSEKPRVKRKFDFRIEDRCEKIETPLCMDIGYNFTDINLSPSNLFQQSEITNAVQQFSRVIELGCSVEMKLLVCAIYTPVCIHQYFKFMPPCRHICEKAKQGCGPIFKKYGVPWPELLRCETFPTFSGDNQMCLHFNRSHISPTNEAKEEITRRTTQVKKIEDSAAQLIHVSTMKPQSSSEQDRCSCVCRQPMISISNDDNLFNKVKIGRQSNCVMSCRSPYFSRQELNQLYSWITALSIACFSVTSLTIGTFFIDGDRFKYPERSIIFLSLCYMFVSLGFLIRAAAGHEAVACGWKTDRALYRTNVPFLCGLVYFLIYFFSMAGAIWWLILSATWFLASGMKWSVEAISNYSQWFHVAAWLLPTLKTMAIFAFSLVDGDPVAGICFVGNQRTSDLSLPLVVPLLLYVGLGSLFVSFSFFDLCSIRTSIKKAKKKTRRLDQLMGRIAVFSLLYVLFSTLLLGCFFYEQQHRNKWIDTYNCRKSDFDVDCFDKFGAKPCLKIFFVKYSVILLTGIANGIWICSKKTIRSWKKFYKQTRDFFCKPEKIFGWFTNKKHQFKDIQRVKPKKTLQKNNKNSTVVAKSNNSFGVHSESSDSSRVDSLVYCTNINQHKKDIGLDNNFLIHKNSKLNCVNEKKVRLCKTCKN